MKDNRGKLLAAFAVLAMVVCAFAAFAPASEGVSEQGTATAVEVGDFDTLANKVGTAGFNVKLTANITSATTLTVSAKGTIDLAGFTLQGTNCHTITITSTRFLNYLN